MPEPRQLNLTWGDGDNKHLLLCIEHDGIVHCVLFVIKRNGRKSIAFELPEDVTLEDVREGWERQGKKWKDVSEPLREGNIYIVDRQIGLGKGSIFWGVHHVDDDPQRDEAFYTPLSLQTAA
jgi:hypothetical protein